MPRPNGSKSPSPAKRGGRTVKFSDMEEEFLLPLSQLEDVHQAPAGTECGRCGRAVPKGEWVFKDEGRTVGVNCCGSKSDIRRATGGEGFDLEDAEDLEGREFVPLSQVMPRNRSKADLCRGCFQIPSVSGDCGC